MSIKRLITSQIKDAIRRYDFEEAISNAMDEIDIEGLIAHSLSERIRDVDFEPLVTDMIQEVIDEELDKSTLRTRSWQPFKKNLKTKEA